MSKIDKLVEEDPYKYPQEEKQEIFLEAMQEAFNFHHDNCKFFRELCEQQGKSSEISDINDLPYMHVDVFKEVHPISVSDENIVKKVESSATTTGIPSKMRLDDKTVKRQRKALSKIMASYIGSERRPFLIIDSKSTLKSKDMTRSSRSTGILGMLQFANGYEFLLEENLELDEKVIEESLESLEEPPVIFGFTFMIYKFIEKIRENSDLKEEISDIDDATIVHTGGWKKLQDRAIEKKEFNKQVAEIFGTKPEKVIDMYGMTEQLGAVYPDCSEGYKHVPVYSDIVIRDENTLEPRGMGETGFIQLLSPIPKSYPGISLLSDDLGEIVGEDDCPCGRKGKYFVFKERSPDTEIKGCGDTLEHNE